MSGLVLKAPLIADPDMNYLWNLKADPRTRLTPPVVSCSEGETVELLVRGGSRLSAIFLNPDLQAPYGTRIIVTAQRVCPMTPLFYLTNNTILSLSKSDLQAFAIRKVIHKPVTYGELLRLAQLHTDIFEASAALKAAELNSDLLNVDIPVEDSAMNAIRAEQFLSGSMSFFDLYIRLGKNRYTKIVRAGERFDSSVTGIHLKNGVQRFYVRVEAAEQYLRYCDHLAALLLRKKGIPDSVKLAFLLNHGEETLKFLRNGRLDETGIAYARRFVEHVRSFVSEMPEIDPERSLAALKEGQGFHHEVISVVVAHLLSRQLGIQADKGMEVIGLAALLHDIALPGEFDENQVDHLTGPELTRFRNHPIDGARMIEATGVVDPAVAKAISQHHERRGQSGFPHRLGMGSISHAAEIVGISEEFTAHLKSHGFQIDAKWRLGLYGRIGGEQFSKLIIEAFRQTFLKGDLRSRERFLSSKTKWTFKTLCANCSASWRPKSLLPLTARTH